MKVDGLVGQKQQKLKRKNKINEKKCAKAFE
jgi:hypothetical protein